MARRRQNPEAMFQSAVIAAAKLHGWMHYHTYDSRRSVAGFPDLVLVRGKRLIFAELKANDNSHPSAAQQEWINALVRTGSCEVYVWRPSNWDGVVELLK